MFSPLGGILNKIIWHVICWEVLWLSNLISAACRTTKVLAAAMTSIILLGFFLLLVFHCRECRKQVNYISWPTCHGVCRLDSGKRKMKQKGRADNLRKVSICILGGGVDKQQLSSAGFKLGQLGLSVSTDLFFFLWAIKRRLMLTVVPIFSFTVYQVVWRVTVPPRSSIPPFAVEAGSNSGSLGALHHCSQVACTLSLLSSILCLLDPNL